MINKRIEFKGFNVTINTTEDCNLRCKYCYETNKKKLLLSFEEIKKFIDILFADEDPIGADDITDDEIKTYYTTDLYQKGLLMDFIGGDALTDPDLLDKTLTYVTKKLFTVDTQNARYWRDNHMFSISSNGTLFTDKAKAFCEKWKHVLQVSVSIDGCPEIHDKNRIMTERGPNNEEIGSMQYILKDWEWYKKTFPESAYQTKSTLAKDSIPYMYESLKYLHESLGLDNINQNFIMENAHLTESDLEEFDRQMKLCVEYVLQHCDDLYWSMIDHELFAKHHLSKGFEWEKCGHCGSGAMPCLGINGNIYPCFRWAPHTQPASNPEPMVVGNINDGFNNKDAFRKVREGAYRNNCTKEEKCRNCEYESACSYCIGGCYAEYQDFIRTTHICEIAKLQCKWAKIYWNEYYKLKGQPLEFGEEFQLK